jgi:hypothetical protein
MQQIPTATTNMLTEIMTSRFSSSSLPVVAKTVAASTKLAATASSSSEEQSQELNLSPREQQVVDFINDLSSSDLPFRIVVIGNGGNAILESTQKLGPNLKVNSSPKAPYAKLLTMSSEDASFEYHLRLAQVASIVIVEKPSPAIDGRMMRLVRLLDDGGQSMTSLIVAPGDIDNQQELSEHLFRDLVDNYGSELKL